VNLQVQQITASVQLVEAIGGGWVDSKMPLPKQLFSKTP